MEGPLSWPHTYGLWVSFGPRVLAHPPLRIADSVQRVEREGCVWCPRFLSSSHVHQHLSVP